MAESRIITDPFEADYLHLWFMAESSCELDLAQVVPLDGRSPAETMADEIRRLDGEGEPEYTARVTAAAVAYGEEELRHLEEAVAIYRAAIKLLRQPRAKFTRIALRVVSPSG
ncbi:hypothetical protein [Methylobacterium sp. NEAU K]|uniref:hypothetical protein n=1 Tax=Methylobacterium sp. NEAU K TaxID=3064946 RepID=UPI0027351A61|nr:hypothetical protein [Methylobacterium sp. NEAU K]MDP4006396.1 hypothetical protein [Methylobacterium sp. NEAU K]